MILMEVKITSIRDNPLLDRREIEIEITHEGEPTPSEEDVLSRIAAEEDLDTDEIEIEGIHTRFGTPVSVADLKVTQEMDLEEYEEEVETTEERLGKQEEELETEEVEEAGDTSGQEEPEEETAEDETEETTADYEEIVSNTISDAKEQLKDIENVDWKKVIEAEKNNKNRKTFKQWLESR